MKCVLRCPKCEEIHDINSRYCSYCGYDLEPYIISFKNKHLPIHLDGGEVTDDACDCL
ncbi:MAG: zinc-ribbon domain-containing protein [Candidatus Heimdallarchaeaceae archaeon]